MKITIITLTKKEIKKRDYHYMFAIEIDGKGVFCVADGEPEDNNINRNFNDVYKLPNLLKSVFEAGKQGGEVIIEEKQVDEY